MALHAILQQLVNALLIFWINNDILYAIFS